MAFTYEVIRSQRRTIAIQLNPDGKILVRCPLRMPDRDVHAFVQSRSQWIEKHLLRQAARPALPPFTYAEIEQMADQALQVIPQRVAHFAPLVGVNYGNITIRNQRTRWGSCSSQGNLNFNCLLMLTPPEVMDYVVVHELCHRKEMNHSKAFWSLVEKVLPDYKTQRKWLKDNGSALISRLVPG